MVQSMIDANLPSLPARDLPLPVAGDVLLLNLDVEGDLPACDWRCGQRATGCAPAPRSSMRSELVGRIKPIAGLLRLGRPPEPPVAGLEALLEAAPACA